jgi:hypothetical protein
LKPTDLLRTYVALYPTKEPLFVHGPPGVGKSDLARQAATEIGGDFLDVRAMLHDPGDLKFPVVRQAQDALHHSDPVRFVNTLFPKDPHWKGIILLDELPQCPPMMQGALLQLCLDRRLGTDYVLPDDAWVCAAGNRAEDRAAVHRLITPLANRFVHVDLDVSHDDWHAWAVAASVVPEVRAFLRFKPDLLHQFDPAGGARAFPTPRAWWKASRILPHLPDDLRHPVLSGTVGEGPAAEFVAFLQIYQQLPDPDQVLANPTGSFVPKEPSVLYALCGALTEKVRRGEPKHLAAFARYVSRLPDEFGVLAMRDACAAQMKLLQVPEAAAWVKSHRDVLLAR